MDEGDQEQSNKLLCDKKEAKGGDEMKHSTFLKKKTTYLRYHIQFNGVNPRNFTHDSLGGLDPTKLPWTIQLETVSVFQYNLMRQGLQMLCTMREHSKQRKLIIN